MVEEDCDSMANIHLYCKWSIVHLTSDCVYVGWKVVNEIVIQISMRKS